MYGRADPVTWSKPPLEVAVTPVSGAPFRLIGVHAKSKAPHGARGDAEVTRLSIENRRKQLAQCVWLRARVDAHLAAGDPLIVLGDFNAGPESREYQDIVGEKSPTYGRLTEPGSFADALTLSGLAEAEGVTLPGGATEPSQRLDHCFVSMDLAGAVKSAWIDDRATGSDHQPVWVQIDIQKQE